MEILRNNKGQFVKGSSSPNKGKHWVMSKEQKRKISESSKGRRSYWLGKKMSEEHRRKIGETGRGRQGYWLGKKHSEETRLKMSEAKKGCVFSEEHKRKLSECNYWKKNPRPLKMSREKAYDTKYKYWMLAVKNRDGWKCRIGNENCVEKLESHHILSWRDYPELRYEINNGITLCQAHHPRKRAEEARLAPVFQDIVSAIAN